MKITPILCLIVMILMTAASLQASTVSYAGSMGYNAYMIPHYASSPYNGQSIPAGEILVNYNSDQVYMYCFDAAGDIIGSAYTVNETTPLAYAGLAGQKAAYLYLTHQGDVTSGVAAAGLQVAIWEVLHETTGTYDVDYNSANAGDFSIENSSSNDVIVTATAFLADLVNFQPLTGAVVLQPENSSRQALIVPEPVSMLTLLSGAALMLRKKR